MSYSYAMPATRRVVVAKSGTDESGTVFPALVSTASLVTDSAEPL